MQCYALQTINCPALVQNAQLLISDRVWTQRGTLHIYSWKITHVHINLIKKRLQEKEKDLLRSVTWTRGRSSPLRSLSQQRLEALASIREASIPAAQVTRPTAKQNSPFHPQQSPKPSQVLIAPTHAGMDRLSGLEWPG